MNWIEFAGHSGAVLSSITLIPQVYKTWRSRKVEDLSLSMMLIVFLSTIIWLFYGISLALLPVIIANGVISILSLMLISFKLTFKEKKDD